MKDAWKNKDIFKKQLELNLRELGNSDSSTQNYPAHWYSFINLIDEFSPESILDVGCGAGSYFKLCARHFKNIKYTGVDYSEGAIQIAKDTWPEGEFLVKDFWDLTKEFVKNYDVIFAGALLGVMPDADKALDFLLNLDAKNIFISRVELTNSDNYYREYKAYDELPTCEFFHNIDEFNDVIQSHNYSIHVCGREINNSKENFPSNFYLIKSQYENGESQ
jgi:trans-aconitate methyltransferase